MINFILGKGNLDVSDMVRKKIAEIAQKSETENGIIYIVPEQFESETEYAIYEILKSRNLRGKTDAINVTTFSALAEGLLSANGDNRPYADDILKSVVMHRAVSELKGSLPSLESISDKQGFCDKISETVSGFKSAGLSTIELEDKITLLNDSDNEIKDTAVFKKLVEVSKIYSHYDQILKAKNYIDSLDVIALSAELIRKSNVFDNADVFVDCFNDFTNDQLRFLCEIIPKAKNVTFGFVTDYENDKCDVFKTANSHITRLAACVDKSEVDFIKTGINDRYGSTALADIPKKLYQENPKKPAPTDSCELISAPDIFEELDFVCAKIKELVEKREIRYNNIAVLCTDLSGCGRYIESAFKKYDIPFFLDMRESILRQPLINAVLTLINALRSFSADAVLSCIKTGFFTKLNDKNERVGLTEHDIGIFEDYLFEWALGTKHLREPFTFTSDPGGDDWKTETAENIRQSVAEPLYEFHKKLKKEKYIDGAELTKQIYNYLIDTVNIECEIQAKCFSPFDGKLDNNTSLMYQRLWDTLVKIFNALYKELGGIKITVDDYFNIFRDVCLSTTLANPPQTVDSVLVGDIDRTRAANIKAAFIIEATFDSFPAPTSRIGIFSQYETDLIHECLTSIKTDGAGSGVYLKSSKEQYQLALYRAYRAVCLPTDYLCISYSERSQSGEPMQISSVSDELEKLFTAPNNESIKKTTADLDDEFYCRSINSAKLRFARRINSNGKENEILKRALCAQNDDCDSFVARLTELKNERENTSEETIKHRISPETAQLLFPTVFGATNIEKIAKCKFSFFCEFGLNVKERKQRTFTAAKRGDAIHFVLEKVLRIFRGDISKFCALRRGELYALSKRYIDKFYKKQTNNNPLSDNREHFLFGNIANAATDTLISMQMDFISRKYRPKFFELDLSKPTMRKIIDNEGAFNAPPLNITLYEDELAIPASPPVNYLNDIGINIAPLTLKLDDNRSVTIKGKIDRVDMFMENGKIYVRVVDYKSSMHGFSPEHAKHGINIQMLMYLSALLDANKANSLTAGEISYIPTKNKGASESRADNVRLLTMNHLSNGLLIVDDVTKKDHEQYSKFILDNISADDDKRKNIEKLLECASINNGGNSPIKLAEPAEFEELQNEVFDGVKNRFIDIFGGVVDALPLVYTENSGGDSKRNDSCEYCRFKSICKNNGKIKLECKEKDDDNSDKKSDNSGDKSNDNSGEKSDTDGK